MALFKEIPCSQQIWTFCYPYHQTSWQTQFQGMVNLVMWMYWLELTISGQLLVWKRPLYHLDCFWCLLEFAAFWLGATPIRLQMVIHSANNRVLPFLIMMQGNCTIPVVNWSICSDDSVTPSPNIEDFWNSETLGIRDALNLSNDDMVLK